MANLLPFLVLALFIVAFWFFVQRPARARQQAQQAVVTALEPGQEVMTTAGMFGTVKEVTDTKVALEVADGVVVWLLRQVIMNRAEDIEQQLANPQQ